MKDDMVKVVNIQDSIIRKQSEVINELFCLLGQFISAEELDGLECVKKVNMAAELKSEIQ